MGDNTIRALVCGHPIAHSRSPLIHGHWLRTFGIDGEYGMLDLAPELASDFFRRLPQSELAGCNVTIPHKEVALAAADRPDDAAIAIGSANTLWLENGKVHATNTDWYGFCANLDDHAPGWDSRRTATILGAGGSARAVIHAVLSRGFSQVAVVNRTRARAASLALHFGSAVTAHGWDELQGLLSRTELLVNTTPLGMAGADTELPDLMPLPAESLVTDIVYIPLETPILRSARARGLEAVDGLGMLLHQAVPGFERWFGRRPDVTLDLRALVIADMERHP